MSDEQNATILESPVRSSPMLIRRVDWHNYIPRGPSAYYQAKTIRRMLNERYDRGFASYTYVAHKTLGRLISGALLPGDWEILRQRRVPLLDSTSLFIFPYHYPFHHGNVQEVENPYCIEVAFGEVENGNDPSWFPLERPLEHDWVYLMEPNSPWNEYCTSVPVIPEDLGISKEFFWVPSNVSDKMDRLGVPGSASVGKFYDETGPGDDDKFDGSVLRVGDGSEHMLNFDSWFPGAILAHPDQTMDELITIFRLGSDAFLGVELFPYNMKGIISMQRPVPGPIICPDVGTDEDRTQWLYSNNKTIPRALRPVSIV